MKGELSQLLLDCSRADPVGKLNTPGGPVKQGTDRREGEGNDVIFQKILKRDRHGKKKIGIWLDLLILFLRLSDVFILDFQREV